MQVPHTMKKTAVAVAVSLGTLGSIETAQADKVTMGFSGLFTLGNAAGAPQTNSDASQNAFSGFRTNVTGTAAFDTLSGAGTAAITPFSFFGGGAASASGVSFQAIGDANGGPGNLVLGNMGFTWNTTTGIPVSAIFDATGFFGAVGGGLNTTDILTAGVQSSTGKVMGIAKITGPLVMTTFNTTNIGMPTTGAFNPPPGGTLPLTTDGISGSPMQTPPFPGFHANFDFTNLHVSRIEPTPQDFGSAGSPSVTVPAGQSTTIDVSVGAGGDQSVLTNLVVPGPLLPAPNPPPKSPSRGTIQSTNPATGEIVYMANVGELGEDSFTYTYTNAAGNSVSAQVFLSVAVAGNLPPTAGAVPDIVTNEDTPVVIQIPADLFPNAVDPDMNNVFLSSFTQPTGQPNQLNGVLVDNGAVGTNPAGGSLTYTPDPNVSAPANMPLTFEFTVTDGQGGFDTATAKIIINAVNDPPTWNGTTQSTVVDRAVTIDPFAGTDAPVDPEGDPLGIASTTQPANGSAVINTGAGPSGVKVPAAAHPPGRTVTYTPNAGFVGDDSFDITIEDGNGGSVTGTVTVQVQQGGEIFKVAGGTFTMPTVSPGGRIDSFGPGSIGIIQNGVYTGFSGASPEADEDPLNQDFDFFGFPVDTYTNGTGVDTGPGEQHPPPFIEVDANGNIVSAQLGSFYAYWNGNEFNQGSTDAINTDPRTSEVTVTDNGNGSVTLSWQSLIVGGSFDQKIGFWTWTICRVTDTNNDGVVDNVDVEALFCGGEVGAAPGLEASQGAGTTRTLLTGGGDVTVSSDIDFSAFADPSLVDISWTADLNLAGLESQSGPASEVANQTYVFDPIGIPNGPLTIKLRVIDKNVDPPLQSVGTVLLTVTTNAGQSPADLVDTDNDGVPDSVDPPNETTVLLDPTGATPGSIETMTRDAGGGIVDASARVGTIALCAGKGALVTEGDITTYGGVGCAPVTNADDPVTVTGGTKPTEYIDFQVHGVEQGGVGYIAIPLLDPLPGRAVWRKYSPVPLSVTNLRNQSGNPVTKSNGDLVDSSIKAGWHSFTGEVSYTDVPSGKRVTVNLLDEVRSAPAEAPGQCPAADPANYSPGLTAGDSCVLLCIVDGGPNDNDGVANGVIVDPGGAAGTAGSPEPKTGDGGCTLTATPTSLLKRADWLVLAGVLGWLTLRRRKRQDQKSSD